MSARQPDDWSSPVPADDPTPPQGWAAMDRAFTPAPGTPIERPAPAPSDGPTLPHPATPRHLQALPSALPASAPRTGAFGRPIGRHRPTALMRLVEVARVLTGGLMVLALVVVVAPLVLRAVGPGLGVVVGHVSGAVVALAATGVAAWRRTPVWAATVAAAAVPVTVLVVLYLNWWA
ncbi:hypothetical protein GCM10023201_19780 [Actinomycetospora corticicola]|uniref:Uncharacterized protein n=1 Tax=Actinomycetospora corticicola TaxID=663602 RepID=A0A7Y9E1W2_9PSEU|nr:hypothetical protein [Actinomycetospora corticicola]NYD39425.1 hypothetical protein [Actinomycetospora corticicola]